MDIIHRRNFLFSSLAALTTFISTFAIPSFALSEEVTSTTSAEVIEEKEAWINHWMKVKAVLGPLILARFRDATYIVAKNVGWEPEPGSLKYKKVEVPVGFVTDLTSVPRIFWSVIPRDGDYVYAAIIHDYLYWTQVTSREDADNILKEVMKDLKINDVTIAAIHSAVRLGGGGAWNNNTKQKAQGDKRILKKFPTSPLTDWKDWKQRSDVFF